MILLHHLAICCYYFILVLILVESCCQVYSVEEIKSIVFVMTSVTLVENSIYIDKYMLVAIEKNKRYPEGIERI